MQALINGHLTPDVPPQAAEHPASLSEWELHFQSLFHEGRALAFPCDASGLVDLDTLSVRARNNYFYARQSIGREFAYPVVTATSL